MDEVLSPRDDLVSSACPWQPPLEPVTLMAGSPYRAPSTKADVR